MTAGRAVTPGAPTDGPSPSPPLGEPPARPLAPGGPAAGRDPTGGSARLPATV